MRKLWVALVLAVTLAGPFTLQSAEAQRPLTPVEVRAKQIQRQRGGWISCQDRGGVCFITARDGKWMITVYSRYGKVYTWEQKR